MSSCFIRGMFLPNDSRGASQWNGACGRTQTTGRLRAQRCKCCTDFRGNHHVCGHRRSSRSLAGRSPPATGTVPPAGPEKSWDSTEQEHPPPGKALGVQRGSCGCTGSDMDTTTYPYLYPYRLEFLGLATQTMGHWESGSKGNCARVEGLQPQGFREESCQPWQEADIALDLNLLIQ